MRQMSLKNIIFAPEGSSRAEATLHRLYLAVCLTLLGVGTGLLALVLAACSYAPLPHWALFKTYLHFPYIVLLNLLPAVLLIWLGWFLFRRAWAAYLLSAVPCLGLALVNYFKIQLRGDPFLASDFRLARTARGILGHYSLSVSRVVLLVAALSLAMLLWSILLMRRGTAGRGLRVGGALVCLALVPLCYATLYLNEDVYLKTENYTVTNRWSDVEAFVSRGFFYPFVRSVPDAFPKPPAGYDAKTAKAFLAQYATADISPERKVNVVGVMLEAFSDLSDYPMLAALPSVEAVYEPLHDLEAQSVSGDLLTNIFAGGTVDSEWGFLTGYSHHDEFRGDVDSYVRYFKSQGYDAVYRHPGYGWFYNRRNINEYLGFDESVFTDNGFGELVHIDSAPYHSDGVLFDFLLRDLTQRAPTDAPLFSFSVSYQNHGPDDASPMPDGIVSGAGTPWSEETCGILDHYLAGINETLTELTRFIRELDALGEPVVLVAYGDHKPWLGNNNSVYMELGVDLDLGTAQGFYNYYATPYLIWANRAAKARLGSGFTGEGGDFSPCFLMPELFDLCSWDGPAFMALAREMRAVSPLLHERTLFLRDGAITDALPPDAAAFFSQYRCAEYWRETKGLQK